MDYRGITVAEDTALRNKFRAADVDYKIYKNNLVRLALAKRGVTGLDDKLTGTLSVAFSKGSEVAAVKVVTAAELKDKMAFKFGLIGNSVLDESGVTALATLPGKETLIAQLLGLLNGAARNLATVLQAVPRNLAAVLDARAKQL
jgi:large subunit ribosomal protein L10